MATCWPGSAVKYHAPCGGLPIPRPVVTGSRGQRLTPRGSSSVWQQTVRGQCLPWSGEEHGIAEEAYRALFDVAARQASAVRCPRRVMRSADELEAFARAASHGLKVPLRGIANYATLLKKDSAALDDESVKHLDTIHWLASRMDDLLNSLLEYSRLGGQRVTSVSLDDVVDDIEDILGARFAEADVELRRPVRLGTVSVDRIRLQEVLVNLVSNAVKYAAADPPRWVEVGCGMPCHPVPRSRCALSTFATTASASAPSSRKTSSGPPPPGRWADYQPTHRGTPGRPVVG